jgi:hypothetical protein
MRKTSLFFIVALALCSYAIAQTQPIPQQLPYTQNFAELAHGSTIYPAGWQGWLIGTGISGVHKTIAPSADEPMLANASASTATGGVLNYDKEIGLLPTGSKDPALAFAFSTLCNIDVKISYVISVMRNPGGRLNEAALQYRIGTTGDFTTIPGTFYQNDMSFPQNSGSIGQFPQTFEITLPASVNNQPVVQIRWLIRDVATNPAGSGGRASFAIESISISGQLPKAAFNESSAAICSGTMVDFTNASSNSTNFEWQKNFTEFSTSLDTSYVFNSAGSYLISLIAEPGACADTASKYIVVSDPVGTIGSIFGSEEKCEGDYEVYYISPVNNATAYVWTLPAGFLGSSSTDSINTIIGSISGTISIVASNSCNFTTEELFVSVNPFPGINITADANEICQGNSAILTATGADFFIWSPTGASNPYTVSPDSSTTYLVSGSTIEGCSGFQSITISVIPVPYPEISQQGLLLSATSHDQYQWFLNGMPIIGETAQNHLATENGNYTVEVIENDCSAITEPLAITTVGISNHFISKINVYPNPTKGTLSINLGDEKISNIYLFNFTGKNVTAQVNISEAEAHNIKTLSLHNLNPGIYYLKLEGLTTNITEKIVLR